MTALTKHFDAEELLPKGVTWNNQIDPKLLILIEQIRVLLGVPCTINNWSTGGDRQWCGLRTENCTIGAVHSQHRLGKAADLHPEGMTADDARVLVKKAVDTRALPLLGGCELGVNWLHVDVRPRVNGNVLWFKA